MVVLGIDPGTARTGYGIVEEVSGSQKIVDCGCIETSNSLPIEQRLKQIYDGIMTLLNTYPVNVVSVEKLFFNKNLKTVVDVNQARGVVLLSSANKGIAIHEYTPLQVKQSIIGSGNATKKQVQFMVKTILSLEKEPQPDDAADALALAICYLNCKDFIDLVSKY